MINFVRFLLIACSMAGMNMVAGEISGPAVDLLNSKRPLVTAHRGYSSIAPENTLPSFKLAMTAGADLVELDYHLSKDGVPIVIHDGELDRTTDATNRLRRAHIKVAETASAEIQAFDAGSWFDPKYAGTRVPTLVEALEFIQKSGVTLIERKGGPAKDLAALLRERALVNQLVVQSFDWKFLDEFHAAAPDQVTGALGPPSLLPDGTKPAKDLKQLTAAYAETAAKTGAKVVVWSKEVSTEGVASAHQRGLKVWVYTIDDPELANRLLDMGIDGIITNNTSLIWRVLALRARG